MYFMYRNRSEAGQILAEQLHSYTGRGNVIVLALPRGGVPVAYEICEALDADMDLMVVRKLGVPGHEELAMGAIAPGGVRVVNDDVVAELGISPQTIDEAAWREQSELERQLQQYRGDRPQPELAGKIVIIVDDGLATGATMRVAVSAAKQSNPQKVIVAVPVAPMNTLELLVGEADDVICPRTPEPFFGVGQWYVDFSQTTDEEVRTLLELAWSRRDGRRRKSA